MRRIDRWVGVPLCAVLTMLRRAGRDGDDPPEPRRMAIVKLSEQGATVVAYPALEQAASIVGATNLHVVVFAENRPVLDLLQVVPEENVLTLRTSSPFRLAVDLLRTIRSLRRLGVDAVVDLESFSRVSAILSYLSGARTRVGLHAYFGEGPYRGDLLTHRVRHNPHVPARAMFDHLVSAVVEGDELPALDRPGTPVSAPRPPVRRLDDVEVAAARELLGLTPRDRPPVVLLNPNAGDLMPLRRWPEDRYVELARRLVETEPELVVAVTGTAAEAEVAGRIVRDVGSERCRDLSGRTTLPELLAVMQQADVLVTNDSGPAHFAALAAIDSVVLFGPESPAVFGPDDPRSTPLWAALACSPCVSPLNDRRSACTDNVCMQRIGVDEVEAAVLGRLRERRATRAQEA